MRAGVIRAEERGESRPQGVSNAMAKDYAAGPRQPHRARRPQVCVEAELAEPQHCLHVVHQPQLFNEVGEAARLLLSSRLVGWRRAFHCRGDAGVDERETVIAVLRCGLARESTGVQGSGQEIGGRVAGEHAARAVAAVGGGSQPHDAHFSVRRSEGGHGPCPIVPFAVAADLLDARAFTVLNQARAGPTRGHSLHQSAVGC